MTVSLAISGPQDTGADGIDTLISIENLTGSIFADKLTGDNATNSQYSGLQAAIDLKSPITSRGPGACSISAMPTCWVNGEMALEVEVIPP